MFRYIVTYWVQVSTGERVPAWRYRPGDMRLERRDSVESEEDPIGVLKSAIVKHENNLAVSVGRITLNNLILVRSRP